MCRGYGKEINEREKLNQNKNLSGNLVPNKDPTRRATTSGRLPGEVDEAILRPSKQTQNEEGRSRKASEDEGRRRGERELSPARPASSPHRPRGEAPRSNFKEGGP